MQNTIIILFGLSSNEFVCDSSFLSLFISMSNQLSQIIRFTILTFFYLGKVSHKLINVVLEFIFDAKTSLILLNKELLQPEIVIDFRHTILNLREILFLSSFLFLYLLFYFFLRSNTFHGFPFLHPRYNAVLNYFRETSNIIFSHVLYCMVIWLLGSLSHSSFQSILCHDLLD